ncbi:tubulin-folding cofactor B isoform X1 [Primulina huaijiensis]|uniref:tubulin-folding cofactor B isoform X1 n=1 Tax=Primulina huaijiensis TaxID=1492673 RepID=UPI003CC6EF07
MASSLLQIPVDDSVFLRVTHSNIKSFSADIRFSLQMTVEAVKEKLWKKCGTTVDSMCLELYDDSGDKVSVLGDNTRPLGFYSPRDGYRLHIIDIDPSSITSGGWLDNTSLVEKYKISEEAYDKLDGTYRKLKEKMGSQHSSHESKVKNQQNIIFCLLFISYFDLIIISCKQISDSYMEDLCVNIKIGDRCQVEPGERRGVIKFVGIAETLAPGFWVGVQYDEPLGKHDGMVKGKRYFDCPPLCGGMVRPDKVKVGDFPERDPFEEEEI